MQGLSLLVALAALCAADPRRYVQFRQGRVDLSQWTPEAPVPSAAYDWSAVSFGANFQCSQVPSTLDFSVTLSDVGNQYRVYISSASNFIPVSPFARVNTTSAATAVYTAAFPSPTFLAADTTYTVHFEKRTEAMLGIARFWDLEPGPLSSAVCKLWLPFADEDSLSLPPTAGRIKRSDGSLARINIEFLGDSLSCGYGNEGLWPCHYSPDSQNGLVAFPALVASLMGVQEFQLQCWSGKGVVRNYGDKNRTSVNPFPVYFNRTVANNESGLWDFSSFVPDVVVITLGNNDFTTAPQPLFDEYNAGYQQLLDSVQNAYSPFSPTHSPPQIFSVCFQGGGCYDNYTQQAVSLRADPNVHFISLDNTYDPNNPAYQGCDYHPTVAADKIVATRLYKELTATLQDLGLWFPISLDV